MRNQSIRDTIVEALAEANILESALERYDVDHMLFTAMKLSNAPHSFVEEVYKEIKMTASF